MRLGLGIRLALPDQGPSPSRSSAAQKRRPAPCPRAPPRRAPAPPPPPPGPLPPPRGQGPGLRHGPAVRSCPMDWARGARSGGVDQLAVRGGPFVPVRPGQCCQTRGSCRAAD